MQTQTYRQQKNIAQFIKEHRTIKLLGLLRGYSALAVVISSTVLVAGTNVAAEENSGSFLFGRWSEENSTDNKINVSEADYKSNLAALPLAKPRFSVDPQAKDEAALEIISPAQNQMMVASAAFSLRDPEEEGGVKIYTVKEGDTVSAIAANFNITVNTILWANDIDNVDQIMPGDKIFILPVAGVKHIVKSGDTLDSIAKKYKADKDKIIAFNNLPADGTIQEGEEIIIPGGQKEIPSPRPSAPSTSLYRQYATPYGGAPSVSGWRKLEGKAGTGHKFPYGYCTWYVSQRRYVPWGGNAGAWLYNAKSMGYYTGKTPKVGAIIVTAESWWGHVGIVESVSGSSITISEMNYERWGKVDRRTLSSGSRVIKGYIY